MWNLNKTEVIDTGTDWWLLEARGGEVGERSTRCQRYNLSVMSHGM